MNVAKKDLPRKYHEAVEHWKRHHFPDQMIQLLVDGEWEAVTGHKVDEAIEDMLGMETGSHVLGAFNIEYDSFVDNIVFACFIDRVGKYQLTMQRVCAYKPMASSMGPMLQEEAFHMAAGVIPLRRWARAAAAGFKDLSNRDALEAYIQEIMGIVDEINLQVLAVRMPERTKAERKQALARLKAGEVVEGVKPEDVLYVPHPSYFRRRGETTADQASKAMPTLKRVGFCPCSKSVRWVVDTPADAG